MSQEVFFVAAVKGREPFYFWQGAIKVEGECSIASLAKVLVEKYTPSHNPFAATVYQLREPRVLFADIARLELADLQTLLQKANELYSNEILQDVLSTKQTLVVLLHCVAPQVPVSPTVGKIVGQADNLKALYEKAWGKTWPSVVHEISRADIGQFGEDDVFPYPPHENDVPEKLQYHCLNGMKEVAKTLGLPTDLQDVVVVLQEYTLLRNWLYTNNENIVVVGHPGTGKSTFLLYLLLHRLERKEPTAIQFIEGRYFHFDEDGARVLSDQVPFEGSDESWVLCDTNPWLQMPSAAFSFAPRIVQVSPPQEERWSQWMKQKGGLPIISELPTVLEIAAVLKELHRKTSKTLDLVGRWGPSIRIIARITGSEHWETNQEYEYQVLQSFETHTEFLRPPPDRNATTRAFGPACDYFIPTKFLHSKVMNQFFRSSNRSQFSFHSASGSPLDFAFEALMHSRMSKRASLKIRNRIMLWDVQTSRNLIHGTVDSLKEQTPSTDFYWIPATSNFPGIDSVLSDGRNLFLLQAIVAGKHRNPKDGILKVWNTMSKQVAACFDWHIIAVTDREPNAELLRNIFSKDLEGLHLGQSCTVWSCVLVE